MPPRGAMTAAMAATQAQGMSPQEAEAAQAAASHSLRQELMAQVEKTEAEMEQERAVARRFLYADVEELLSVGFLSHTIEVNGVSLSLRSLSPGDLYLLRSRVAQQDLEVSWKTWAVAHSIWMVDGWNLLGERNAAPMLYRLVQTFPKAVIDKLFYSLMGLFARVGLALRRTEAFCYEPYSRSLWGFCGRKSPAAQSISGIPGTDSLGANHVQRMWLAFNLGEDDRLQHKQMWSSAKLVASANSPKGIKKINQSDDNLEKREDRRRKAAIARMVNEARYGEEFDEETGDMVVVVRGQAVKVPRVRTAHTTEDLEEEMRMWVAGEKDFHDLVVDSYKSRIKAQFDEEKRQRERSSQQLPVGVYAGTSVVGYTPDQLEEFRPDLFQNKGGRKVFDGGTPLAVYSKWVDREVGSGKLEADEFGVREREHEAPSSLQDQVASRRPAFSTTPIGPGKRGSD